MTEKVVFHSSFDSTRYTGDVRRANHPNLAQAQAEAVTSLLLGRSLVLQNTYAFDSGSVLNLAGALLDTRSQVWTNASPAGRHRIDTTNPILLRWFGGPDFLSCCVDQLLRLEPANRFILSHWKAIDADDQARRDLAAALMSPDPQPPAALREHPQLEESFSTVIRLSQYCRGYGRGEPAGKAKISLLAYLEDLTKLERPEIERMVSAMNHRYGIDVDKVMQLRRSISQVDPAVKSNRSWAHEAARRDKDPFLQEQRQLVDTLYNEVLADSAGADVALLSSVPKTAGWSNLEQVNAFALELIKHSRTELIKHSRAGGAADDRALTEVISARDAMSEAFVAVTAQPHLPAPQLRPLLHAYWELIADDDMWMPWRDSCDQLEYALLRARRLQQAGFRADSRLAETWQAHLDTLQQRLPHVRLEGKALIIAVGFDEGTAYQTRTRAHDLTASDDEPGQLADSLAAGQYIDRYMRGIFR